MGLKFDGVDLKEQFGFVVTKADGRGSPPISSTKLVVPRVDGAVLLNQRMDVRRISISGYVYGSTAAEAAQKKDGLIKLISTAYNSEKKLQFPDTNRYIYVRLAGEPIVIGPVGPVFGAYAYEISLNFEAIDPYFYGDEFNYNDAGFVFSVDADAPIYLISPRREFLEHEPNVTIYPVTIVNLLGKYGDFETDSNGDGLADGWGTSGDITTRTIVSGVINFHAQKLVSDNSGGSGIVYTMLASSQKTPANAGEVYFMSAYMKRESEATTTYEPQIEVYFYDSNGSFLGSERGYSHNSTSWERVYTVFTTPSNTAQVQWRAYHTVPAGDIGAYSIDGYCAYNLTAMGALPPTMQEYYGVTNWADLDEDTLAQLLPFVNGVATLGFMWAGDL